MLEIAQVVQEFLHHHEGPQVSVSVVVARQWMCNVVELLDVQVQIFEFTLHLLQENKVSKLGVDL